MEILPGTHSGQAWIGTASVLIAILRGRRADEERLLGRIQVAVGDFTSSRRLVSLPNDFGHAAGVDVVAFLSTGHDADARIAKALMKLEALFAHTERSDRACGREHRRPRVVAELFDTELARRLRQHFAERHGDAIRILSTQALRALFLHQSVIVPSFDAVYAELLGPWGQSLLRMVPTALPERVTYAAIADALEADGAVLIALEVRSASDASVDLWVGDAPSDEAFASARVVCAWVIATDQLRA